MRTKRRTLSIAVGIASTCAGVLVVGCSTILGLHDPVEPLDASIVGVAESSVADGAVGDDGANPSDSGSPPSDDDGGPGSGEGGGGCDGCGPAPCTPNSARCSPTVTDAVENCNAQGQWSAPNGCAYVCSDGGCAGECVPDASSCGPLQTPQTCGSDGHPVSGTPCAAVCVGGQCAGSCVPGSHQCTNLTPEECGDAGTWVDGIACPYLCDDGGCTGECLPNDTQCTSGVQQTCSGGGIWASPLNCPYLCVGKVCGGECAPGTSSCPSDTQKQTCSAGGMLNPPTTCPSACVGSDCGGHCVPGTYACASNSANEECGTNGEYGAATACIATSPICMNGNCAFHVGLDQAGGATDTMYAGYIYAVRFTASAQAKAYRLGMFGTATSGTVRMGIFSEGSNSLPSGLLGSTSSFSTVSGASEAALSATLSLQAGTSYWIAAIAQANVSIAFTSGGAGYAANTNTAGWNVLTNPFPPGSPISTNETPDFYVVLENY